MKFIKKLVFVLVVGLYAVSCHADYMQVTLLGTGSPRPDVNRAGPAVLVEAGGLNLLFDAGRNVVTRLAQYGVQISAIQHVFVTHLHSDHISALDDIWLTGWIYQRQQALHVYGPEGVEPFVENLPKAYAYDTSIRHQYAGLEKISGELQATTIKPGVIFEQNGVKVTAFLVEHKPVEPAFGYRVDFGDRSVVISGDTTYSENLIKHSAGVDLLIHEIFSATAPILKKNPRLQKIERYHTNPAQLVSVLQAAKPRAAALTHVILVGVEGDALLDEVKNDYAGDIYLGEDLMLFEIGSKINVKYHNGL